MLDFYYSTMSGGKSTALLQRRHNLTSIGKRVLVMTSALDDRFGIGTITSRMGPQCDAVLYSRDTVFDSTLDLGDVAELMLDEAQFLTGAQVRQIHENFCARGQRVSCFGLRSTFQGLPFEGSAALMAIADNLHELSTLCQCGSKATLNQRIDALGHPVRSGPEVEIGGDNRYRPVCASCFYAVSR